MQIENPRSKLKSVPQLYSVDDLVNSNYPKRKFKFLRCLKIVHSPQFPPHTLKTSKIRALKSVKYLSNLHQAAAPKNRILDQILSQKRNIPGKITINYPDTKTDFLRKLKSTRELNVIIASYALLHMDFGLKQAIKKLGNLHALRFSALEPNTTLTSKTMEGLMQKFSRRSIYAFYLSGIGFDRVNFFNFQWVKLQSLCLQRIDQKLLGILLLKARALQNLERLNLGTLEIIEEFPSYLMKNLAEFPKLNALCLHAQLKDKDLSLAFLQNFRLGASLETLHLILDEISFPNPLTATPEEYSPYENFAKHLSSAINLKETVFKFLVQHNFRGMSQILSHLPLNLKEMEKVSLEFALIDKRNSSFEDTRVIMSHIYRWIFTMPKLKEFWLETLNRDYTNLSKLEIPETLPWRCFDILEWPDESQDTIKPADFQAFMKIFQRAKNLECLNLSIESSSFDLDAFRNLAFTLTGLRQVKELNLKLNCRKFSPYDYELLQPCLAGLSRLEVLSLMFISNGVSETEQWTYRLCKTFEMFQKLKNFNLSFYGPTKPIFMRNYFMNIFRPNNLGLQGRQGRYGRRNLGF